MQGSLILPTILGVSACCHALCDVICAAADVVCAAADIMPGVRTKNGSSFWGGGKAYQWEVINGVLR